MQSMRLTPKLYNLPVKPRPKLFHYLFIKFELLMLLPLVTCSNIESSSFFRVEFASQRTFNILFKQGSMATLAIISLHVILAFESIK